jgi:hypothetical protein
MSGTKHGSKRGCFGNASGKQQTTDSRSHSREDRQGNSEAGLSDGRILRLRRRGMVRTGRQDLLRSAGV